jgi:hypothetical protein
MAYRTRTSSTIEKAQKRNLAIQSIDPSLDLGNGLTVSSFTTLINNTQQKVDRYNLAISSLTQLYSEMMEYEKLLADQHERMLNGVSSKYGRNSTEYEMAGGRKRATKRKTKVSTTITELPTITLPTNPTNQSDSTAQVLNAMMN